MNISIRTLLAIAFIFSLSACYNFGERVRKESTYTCGKNVAIVKLHANDNLTMITNGSKYSLTPSVSASGAKYSTQDDSTVFWSKGDEAYITVNGIDYEDCQIQKE